MSQTNEQFTLPDGSIVGTGAWPSPEPPRFAVHMSTWLTGRIDQKDVLEIINNPHRVRADKRFPSKTWIRNQGRRGSCNGYAAAWMLARARVWRGLPFVALSGESVYAQINGGVDRGSGLREGWEALEKNGAAPESLVQRETYLWRDISPEARREMKNYRGFELAVIENEWDLVVACAFQWPCVVAMHYGNGSNRVDENGYIQCRNGPGNHAVGVQDVFLERGRWKFQGVNSHGLGSWDQGYGYFDWDSMLAGPRRNHVFYAIRAATDSERDANPVFV